jgi:hypothetical protein
MAKLVHTILVDDLDKVSEATESVVFSLDGVTYEIDLTSDHANELRDGLDRWIAAGRRLPGRVQGRRPSVRASLDETAKIRAWAREQGLEISDRGRVSAPIRDAYRASH